MTIWFDICLKLTKSGFEPWSSGVGIDHFVNSATSSYILSRSFSEQNKGFWFRIFANQMVANVAAALPILCLQSITHEAEEE